ncbi:MAG TPA: alpha/beta hydrolase [Mycobacteriales bacterium]|nr:alpha/beta hydrolase [Mycobacteriales bacterium]
MSSPNPASSDSAGPRALVASDGQRLAYTYRGTGPRLICLPGGPGRAAAYLEDLGGLDGTYELVLADPRGSGGSRPAEPDSLNLDRLAQDVEELRLELDEKRPVLVGHSFGCRVASAHSERFPGVARALVLLTPPPFGESALVADGRELILDHRQNDPLFVEAVEAARALPDARPRDRSMLEAMSMPLWYGRWDGTAREHAARAADETPARTALTLRNAALSSPPVDLAALDLPVLVVAGELDYASPPGALRAVHERLPHSSYVELAGAGHYPWLDDPAALRDAVAGFLDALGDQG